MSEVKTDFSASLENIISTSDNLKKIINEYYLLFNQKALKEIEHSLSAFREEVIPAIYETQQKIFSYYSMHSDISSFSLSLSKLTKQISAEFSSTNLEFLREQLSSDLQQSASLIHQINADSLSSIKSFLQTEDFYMLEIVDEQIPLKTEKNDLLSLSDKIALIGLLLNVVMMFITLLPNSQLDYLAEQQESAISQAQQALETQSEKNEVLLEALDTLNRTITELNEEIQSLREQRKDLDDSRNLEKQIQQQETLN